jgi:hypothetical protein
MSKLIGTAPHQVPTNADLGTLAYQNAEDTTLKNLVADRIGVGTDNPAVELDLRGDMRLDSSGLTDRIIYFRNQNSVAKIRSDKALAFDAGDGGTPTTYLTIGEGGKIVVADAGLVRHGHVGTSLPPQSFSYSVSPGGEFWYKLCEVDNPWKGEIHYFMGCNNAEEHGIIRVKTTWTVSNLQLELERQTYNSMLKDVRLDAPANGSNYTIWVLVNADSDNLISTVNVRWQIVNAFCYYGSSHFENAGVVNYFNTTGTPATNRTSVNLTNPYYNVNNIKITKGSQVIESDIGSVPQTLATTADVALRLHGRNAWTGIQFTDSTDAGTGATQNIYYNGSTSGGTFAIGGSGANAANKVLHVHGGLTVGQNLNNTATATGNDAIIQGSLGVGSTTAPPTHGGIQVGSESYRYLHIIGGLDSVTDVSDNDCMIGVADSTYTELTGTNNTGWLVYRARRSTTAGRSGHAFYTGTSNTAVLKINADGSIVATGAFSAASKSFDIEHPTKEGMRLHHGSLEGPEHGVYVRGRLKDSNIIELPDYWDGLVDLDSITVQLTAIGGKQDLWIEDIDNNTITVGSSTDINCFYFVQAERKDVDKFDVEYEAE